MERFDDTADHSPAARGKRIRNHQVLTLLLACAIAGGIVLSIMAGTLPPVAGILGVAVVLFALFWQIRAHLPSILLVFVTVLFVSVVATHQLPKLRADRLETHEGDRLSRSWMASGDFDQDLPIVVHLMFDEMMSVGAITDDLPGGSEMRRSMLAFGEKHSFRMFDSVYSRHFLSGEALPTMMGNEYLGRTSLADQRASLANNNYFADMAGRGYRTVVFQNDLMNFCADGNVDMCETFNSFDPGGKGAVGLDPRNQRASLWQTVIRAYEPSYASGLGKTLLASIYGLRTGEVGVLGAAGRYDVQRFPNWFDRFTRFASNVPRGTHVVGYFLVPHSPYLLSENCVVSGTLEGGYYLGKFPLSERAERRRKNYEGYFAQLRCVQQKLDDFMAAIRQSPNFRDAVIIIHGDHGSRISIGNILEDYIRRDFVDNYPTFFAVRSPAVAPGVDCEFVSLPEIFRRHTARWADTAPRTGAPLPVFVDSRTKGRVEATMPLFGCAEGTPTESSL